MKFFLLISSILLSSQLSFGATFTVNSLAATNTGSGLSGTLRWCMTTATITPGGPHTINFSVAGTIAILNDNNVLPNITSAGLTIDGTTAPGYSTVPVIIIDATGTTGYNLLTINTSAVTIKGIDFTNSVYSTISVSSAGNSFMIDACVVRNSLQYGITINGASNGIIKDCYIGVNNTGISCAANNYDGINIQGGGNNQIIDCHIACNLYNGIQLGSSSNNNIIKGNIIGPLMSSCTSNGYRGIDIEGGSMNNIIGGILPGEGNKIAGNEYWGIEVKEAGTIGNIISGNSMSCNSYNAIDINSGGNNNIAAPVITAASPTSVSGTSLAFAVIEIFRAQDATVFGCAGTPVRQGVDYLGTTTATSGGTWTLAGTYNGFLVATQRTVIDGSSTFSNAFNTGDAAVWVNGCEGPFVTSVITNLSAGEIVNTSIKLYPNPACQYLTLTFSESTINKIDLKIYSAFGEQVFTQENFYSTGTTTLDISQFAAGIYFMHFYDGVKYYTKKFIIVKR